jgi:hypothetical protein
MHSEPQSSNNVSKTESPQPTSPPNEPPNSKTSEPPPRPDPSSDEQKLPRGLVEHRTFNHTIIAIGKRGSGKSQWCIRRCLDFARIPAMVVAHDVGWKTPDKLHDGTPTFIRRYDSTDEARQAIARDPRGIHLISEASALPVAELAKELAAASLEKHGGDRGHPVILYIDEIVSAEVCNPHHMEPSFKRLLAEARHEHVGIVAGVQSARLLNNQLLTLATHVQLFQITDRRDHARLVECGIDEEIVAHTPGLKVGESITVRL